MIALDSLKIAQGGNFLNQFISLGTRVSFTQHSLVTLQYMRGTTFYLLESGELTVSARKSEDEASVQLGIIKGKYAPVGWSAMNPPYRYAVEIAVRSSEAALIAFDIKKLMSKSSKDHSFGIRFFQFVLSRSNHLITESLEHLSQVAPRWDSSISPSSETFEEVKPRTKNLAEFLQKSPFFETFEDADIKSFAGICRRRVYRSGDTISSQHDCRDGFYILNQGWVDLIYESEAKNRILYRSISTPGFSLSWVGLQSSANYASAIARQTTSIYFFDFQKLNELFKADLKLAYQFFKRMLWLVNHQTQVVRARFLTFTHDIEWVAVKTLVDANATRLALDSPLHEIPHLLKHKHSQKRAFDTLHDLHNSGDIHEKHLASVALDNLQELSKEYLFYQGLIKVYQSVSLLPDKTKSETARSICAKVTISAFEYVDYTIEGWEHLPEKGGHIFIYNHLKNHPYNTLPNNFQVTLDSHFISAKICYEKYRDAGLRVVRVGKDMEYGHQEYYEKLGHIDVFTADSEQRDQNQAQKEKARNSFYLKAGKYLALGKNLIISPEGSSYETAESPGPFKSGAFRLALSQKDEPWIVPVVIANFDKRVRHNQFRCKIFAPFKISEKISDPQDSEQMKTFLTDYQTWYKSEVKNLAGL
jgi:CRP-like cAMP-binding protein